MNREMKRRLQRQGELGPDGAPAPKARGAGSGGRPPRGPRGPGGTPGGPGGKRTRPTAFLREVRGELRKVAWPTRAEVINYSIVVFMSLVFIILLIFLLDTAFAKSIFYLFDT